MADRKRVFLHIGAPKTGTTFLQQVLRKNRKELATAGVLYPRVGREAHHTAVWALRKTFDKAEEGGGFADHWVRLVRQSLNWAGDTVVISSELFCFSRGPKIAEIVTAFGDSDVHVVYTARDLMRQVPAVWQEQVKNRQDMPYQDYLVDVLGKRATDLSRVFWGGQDAPAVLARWSRGIDARHVHVVVAPPDGSDSGVLWKRFAGVVGLDVDRYGSDIPPANPSLSVEAAETLRRYNERYAHDLPILQYRRMIRRQLDPAFAHTRTDSSRFPLTSAQRATIVDLSERMVDQLRKTGYKVAGSLDELVPRRASRSDPVPGRGPDDVSDTEIVRTLLDVLDYVLRRAG